MFKPLSRSFAILYHHPFSHSESAFRKIRIFFWNNHFHFRNVEMWASLAMMQLQSSFPCCDVEASDWLGIPKHLRRARTIGVSYETPNNNKKYLKYLLNSNSWILSKYLNLYKFDCKLKYPNTVCKPTPKKSIILNWVKLKKLLAFLKEDHPIENNGTITNVQLLMVMEEFNFFKNFKKLLMGGQDKNWKILANRKKYRWSLRIRQFWAKNFFWKKNFKIEIANVIFRTIFNESEILFWSVAQIEHGFQKLGLWVTKTECLKTFNSSRWPWKFTLTVG